MTLLALVLALIPAIYGRNGLGHACPISATDALTAEHVSTERYGDGLTAFSRPLIYTQTVEGVLFTGVVQEVDADLTRDLSLIRVIKGDTFARWFNVATIEPVKGDKVFILGYDFDKGGTPKLVEAKVLFSDGPTLTYDKNAEGGSSGSCVLNEAKEIVAINTGYFNTYRPVGRAVSVWGRWREFLVSEYSQR